MDEACTHTAEALAVENPIGGNSDRGTRTGEPGLGNPDWGTRTGEPGLGEPGLGEPGLWGTRTGGTRTMGNPAYGEPGPGEPGLRHEHNMFSAAMRINPTSKTTQERPLAPQAATNKLQPTLAK